VETRQKAEGRGQKGRSFRCKEEGYYGYLGGHDTALCDVMRYSKKNPPKSPFERGTFTAPL